MPGLDSLCGVWDIKHLKTRPREKEARELLEKIADQVKPICVAHKWNVEVLEEFVPPNAGLLGMNVNRKKIFIRLRPASDVGSFYPYEALLHTMLHELVHMEIGPHNAKFYKMLDELRDECENLMREGITGRNMPFAGNGKQLGGGRTAVDARAAALKAAEKRQRQQRVMGSGRRLGGSAGASGSAAERAAAAAEWRAAVSRGCAATHHGTSSQADGGCGGHGSSTGPRRGEGDDDDAGWDCDLCTLHNSSELAACDACGTPRRITGRPHDPPSSSGGGGGGTRARKGASDGKRPAGTAGTRLGLPKAPYRPARAPTAASGNGGGSSSIGRPAVSTWTCRECPFAFPNAAERRTCESCGARRAEEGAAAGATPSAGDADTSRRQGLPPPPPTWECGRCTMVNPKDFLVCEACRAPTFGPGAWTGVGGFAGSDANRYQGGAWMGGSGSGGSSGGSGDGSGGGSGVDSGGIGVDGEGQGAVGDSSSRGRVCGVCTLRNHADAFACAACGIPLAESEAATGEAAAVVAWAAATSTNGDGAGRLAGRHPDREDNDDGEPRRSVNSNEPDLIDLS